MEGRKEFNKQELHEIAQFWAFQYFSKFEFPDDQPNEQIIDWVSDFLKGGFWCWRDTFSWEDTELFLANFTEMAKNFEGNCEAYTHYLHEYLYYKENKYDLFKLPDEKDFINIAKAVNDKFTEEDQGGPGGEI